MEPPEQLKQKVLNEKRLTNRLCLASARLEDAQQEHIWALAAAKSEGLSIRKIAAATGLSSSRVHQLLHTLDALQMPEWLNSLTEHHSSTDEQLPDEEMQSLKPFQSRLAEETEVTKRRREQGEGSRGETPYLKALFAATVDALWIILRISLTFVSSSPWINPHTKSTLCRGVV